jgi:hypothetical protein
MKRSKERGLRTDFVRYKNETLAVRFAPAQFFLYHQSAPAPSWVTGIEHEDDADVVLYLRCCSFVLLAAADIRSDETNEISLANADSASWASEESVGSDAIVASSFRGDCGGD